MSRTMADTPKRRARRQFAEEFKASAVRLVLDEGKTVSAVARDLDLIETAIAVAHSILVIAYYILRDDVAFQDLGVDHFDRMNSTKAQRYHLRRLEELGCDVSKVAAA